MTLSPSLTLMILVATLIGVGCRSAIDTDAPKPTDRPTAPADQIPRPGETYGERRSADGQWIAYTISPPNSFDHSLVVRGPSGFYYEYTHADPRPVGFSQDNTMLLFVDSGPNGWDSLFILRLSVPGLKPIQVTNKELRGLSAEEQARRATPTPYNDMVDWEGHIVRFKNPDEPLISIDLDAM